MFLISRGHHFLGVEPKVLEHETTDTGFCFLSYTATTNWRLALLGNGEHDLQLATAHHHDCTGHWHPLDQPIDLDPRPRSWNTNSGTFDRSPGGGLASEGRILVLFRRRRRPRLSSARRFVAALRAPSHTRFIPTNGRLIGREEEVLHAQVVSQDEMNCFDPVMDQDETALCVKECTAMVVSALPRQYTV